MYLSHGFKQTVIWIFEVYLMIKDKSIVGKKSSRKRDVILKNEGLDFNKLANRFRIYFKEEI